MLVARREERHRTTSWGKSSCKAAKSRRCRVLEVDGGECACTTVSRAPPGINLSNSKVRFLGRTDGAWRIARICSAACLTVMGRPIDGGTGDYAQTSGMDVNGLPINPAARSYPQEFIQTGVSAIDGLNTLVRGQKLPIFSASGLPHAQLGGADRAAGQGARHGRALCRGVCRDGHHV